MERRGGSTRSLAARWAPVLVAGAGLGAYVLAGPIGLAVLSLILMTGLIWIWWLGRGRPVFAPRGTSLADRAEAAVRATRNGQKRVCLMTATVCCSPSNADDMAQIISQARAVLRDNDQVIELGNRRLAILTAAQGGLRADSMLAVARRVQTAVEMPQMRPGRDAIRVRVAIGLASAPRAKRHVTGAELVHLSLEALARAESIGPSGIWSADPPPRRPIDTSLVIEARRALDTDQIVPWFQPQICTRTGRLIGVEALARWEHPERGVISPGGFLPALEQAGVSGKLSEVMLHHGCAALKAWDAAGVHVPFMALNLSGEELATSGLAQRIAWDLEAHSVEPARLRIEILETVAVAAAEGTAGDNIAALRAMGCPIDLDDFGTGNATIAAVEQFGVDRLKIDRSFVSGIDQDPRQQRLVAAIIAMATQMGLETLAEGLETEAELTTLSRMGCGNAQGFAVARPMPMRAFLDWARIREVPPIRASGT